MSKIFYKVVYICFYLLGENSVSLQCRLGTGLNVTYFISKETSKYKTNELFLESIKSEFILAKSTI